MFGYYYGIDTLYLYLVLPAIILSLFASIKVKSSFSKYSKISANLSGADAARRVLEANGVQGVRIERVRGHLTDHFDPKTNIIRLSESVYDSYSISAVGVAAHEAGHAVQYAKGYTPIKVRPLFIFAYPFFLFFSFSPFLSTYLLVLFSLLYSQLAPCCSCVLQFVLKLVFFW